MIKMQVDRYDLPQVFSIVSRPRSNGKITSQKDMITGEEVQYTYDSLTRLIAGSTTAASDQVTTPWGPRRGGNWCKNCGKRTS